MKKIVYGAAGAVLIAVMLFFVLRGDDTPQYRTEELGRGTIRGFCTATGTVNPLKTVLVGTQVSGRIQALYADYNSVVQQGQLVAEIDPETFEAQLEQARANLLSAQANLKQAEAVFNEAERSLRRIQELYESGVVGQSELDAIVTEHVVAQSKIGVARAQVAQSEAAYRYAETNLRYTKIYSPVDGIVISRDVDVGQTVAATFQTPTLFTIAEDMQKMQINTNVDEADIGQIASGQVAEFSVDAYPQEVFAGRVEQVRNSPVIVQNVVTYDVVIYVDNSGQKLKPGMTANVTIYTDTRDNVLRIPSAALRFKPEESREDVPAGNGTRVWVYDGKDIRSVPVTIGIDDYTYVELVAGKLQPGDLVVVGYEQTED